MEGAQEGAGAAGQGASKLPGNALVVLRLLKHKKLSTSKLLVQSLMSSQLAMYLCNARYGIFLSCYVNADIRSTAWSCLWLITSHCQHGLSLLDGGDESKLHQLIFLQCKRLA